MSATRIARLEEVLMRGLDMGRQNPDHDARWLALLAEYEALVDRQRADESHAALTQGALAINGGRWA